MDAVHLGNVLDLGYSLNVGAGDNGNVAGITNHRDTSRSQTFTYDALNRLTSAQNAGTDCSQKTVNGGTKYWGNSYGYDPWGNLLSKSVTKCSAENLNVTALANNQLYGYGYDAAGNMTHDATTGNNYSYHAENRITGAAGYTYTYDADGNRVEKSNGSTGTIYWSMSPGIVAESDLSGMLKSEYIFFGGKRVARKDFSGSPTSVSYYFYDELKTADVITDSAGTIKSESDYFPFGLELSLLNGDSNKYKHNGKERDGETGNDYYGARYYSPALSRFLTPDFSSTPVPVPYADLSNPQTLNQYAFAHNNPTSLDDPDGHDPLLVPGIEVSTVIVKEGLKSFWHWLTSGPPPHALTPDPFPSLPRSCICSPGTNQNQNNDSKQNNNSQSQNTGEQGRDAQGKFVSKQPGQAQPGSAAEKEALDAVGATKNTEKLNGNNTGRDSNGNRTARGSEIRSIG